ncbi:hypothetical protein [Sporosarcina sp. NPDC096371]|uniref:hypothetical protein n=1 Tax=Sporosarcina sp. NPDC096371 TaxID=3364530 RepID=UPI00382DF091
MKIGEWKILEKAIFPLIYVGEWILYVCVLLFIIMFNMANLFNLIYIDMVWEEPISFTSSFGKSWLIALGIGLIIYFYIRNLIGNRMYKIVKEVLWGILFRLNSLSCILWLIVSQGSNYSKDDRILLLAITLFSILLTIQIIIKLRNEIK